MVILQVILLLLIISCGECLECFQCTGATQMGDCTKSITCPANTHCHIRKYFLGGRPLYDMDCKALDVCRNQEVDDPADTEDSGYSLWSVCCHQDYCSHNIDDKGKIIPASQRTIDCYTCDTVSDPASCTQKQTCGPGEICLTNEHIDLNGKSAYHMMCLAEPVCDNLLNMAKSSPSKRKALCTQCCGEDGCNNKVCRPTNPVTSSSNQIVVTKQPALPPTTTPRPTYNEHSLYHLAVQPASLSVHPGDVAIFDCLFQPEVYKPMTITWFFTGLDGRRHEVYQANKKHPELKYVIPGVEVSDSGMYECEAKMGNITWNAIGTLVIS